MFDKIVIVTRCYLFPYIPVSKILGCKFKFLLRFRPPLAARNFVSHSTLQCLMDRLRVFSWHRLAFFVQF